MSVEYKCNICKKKIGKLVVRDKFEGSSVRLFEHVDVGNYSVCVQFHILNNVDNFLVCKTCEIPIVKKACKQLKVDD
jgi:hypothetical protein